MTMRYALSAKLFGIAVIQFLMVPWAAGQYATPQRRVMDPQVEARVRTQTGISNRGLLLWLAEGKSYLEASLKQTLDPGYREVVASFLSKPRDLPAKDRRQLVHIGGVSDLDLLLRLMVAFAGDEDLALRSSATDSLIGAWGGEVLGPFSEEIVAGITRYPLDEKAVQLLIRVELPDALRKELLTRRGLGDWERALLGDEEAETRWLSWFSGMLQACPADNCSGDFSETASKLAWLRSPRACQVMAQGLSSKVTRDTWYYSKKAVAFDLFGGWMQAHPKHQVSREFREMPQRLCFPSYFKDREMQDFLARFKKAFKEQCNLDVAFEVTSFHEGAIYRE